MGYKQWHLAKYLAYKNKKPYIKKTKKHYIYCARIGGILKIGMSSNVHSRLKSYQTSSDDVELIGKYCLGVCAPFVARQCESKVHQKLKKYNITREIFKVEASKPFLAICDKPILPKAKNAAI